VSVDFLFLIPFLLEAMGVFWDSESEEGSFRFLEVLVCSDKSGLDIVLQESGDG
jgi:hypothetical protein